MLDIMRRKKRLKLILWIVIISLALGMLLFFVPGANVGNMDVDTSAAKVDGKSISINDLRDSYKREIERFTNRGKNRIPPETLKALGIGRQVLEMLINTQVMQNTAERFGISVTPDEVRKAIENHPSLQYQGKFIGLEQYKDILRTNNLTVTQFEAEIHDSLMVKKLHEIVTDSLRVSDGKVREEFARANQETQVDFVLLKKDDLKKRVKPSEADLRAYFDKHKDDYRIKEKRRAQYLLVPASQIISTVQVSDDEILQEWNQRSHEETVDAAHILFRVTDPAKDAEVKAKAEKILKQAKAGADFAELAKKYSEDPSSANQGGSLGSFPRNTMIKELEDAAFSLEPGKISELIKTQHGYHIIKVLRHNKPSLESDRNNIISTIQIRKAQELARQKAEEAAQLAVKQKDFSAIAKEIKTPTEIQESGFFGKDDNPFAIGLSQPLRDEIFTLKEIGSIGKAVEHPLGYAVPKLTGVQLPKPGEFSESRPKVETDYINYKSGELIQSEAKKLIENAVKFTSLEKAAKEAGLTVKASKPFKLDGTADPDIGPNYSFNSAAFDLAPGAISNPIPLADNLAVFQVKSRSPYNEIAFLAEKPQLQNRILQSMQDVYFQEYIRKITEQLNKAGKIRINSKALEQLERDLNY